MSDDDGAGNGLDVVSDGESVYLRVGVSCVRLLPENAIDVGVALQRAAMDIVGGSVAVVVQEHDTPEQSH